MRKRALILTALGGHAETDLGDGIERMQAIVGGSFDVCRLATPDGEAFDVWVHDEGLLIGLPVNATATNMLVSCVERPSAPLVGDVFLTGGVDDEGNTLPVTDAIVEFALSKLARPF